MSAVAVTKPDHVLPELARSKVEELQKCYRHEKLHKLLNGLQINPNLCFVVKSYFNEHHRNKYVEAMALAALRGAVHAASFKRSSDLLRAPSH